MPNSVHILPNINGFPEVSLPPSSVQDVKAPDSATVRSRSESNESENSVRKPESNDNKEFSSVLDKSKEKQDVTSSRSDTNAEVNESSPQRDEQETQLPAVSDNDDLDGQLLPLGGEILPLELLQLDGEGLVSALEQAELEQSGIQLQGLIQTDEQAIAGGSVDPLVDGIKLVSKEQAGVVIVDPLSKGQKIAGVLNPLKTGAANTFKNGENNNLTLMDGETEAGKEKGLLASLESSLAGRNNNGEASGKSGQDFLNATEGSKLNLEMADTKTGFGEKLSLLQSMPLAYRLVSGQPVASALVPVQVGQAGWDTAVAEKLVWFSVNRVTSAQMDLNPPDLGPLQVRIKVEGDQTTVNFTSHSGAVREALEVSMPRLKEMLEENGLELGNVDVSGKSEDQGEDEVDEQPNDDEVLAQDAANDAETAISQSISTSINLVDYYA